MSDYVATTRFTYDHIAVQFLENTRERSLIGAQLGAFVSSLTAKAVALDLGSGPGADSALLVNRPRPVR